MALICGVLLFVLDSASGGELNLFAWTREKIAKEKEEKEKKQSERYHCILRPACKGRVWLYVARPCIMEAL